MIVFGEKCFTNPLKTIAAFNSNELKKAFAEIEELKNNFYIAGYVRYNAFKDVEYDFPLLYFQVFDTYNIYKTKRKKILLPNPVPNVNFCEYSDAIKKIKKEIADGNTYEVNYTYDFELPYDGDDFELFEYLLQKQKTLYNFYMKNEYDTVLSFSPELFFTLKDNHILTKPMKGTVKRGKTPDEDRRLIEFLQNDEKNRAENVMIVDLLRNDLGRIAKTGTVKVSKLFEIETHKTLHQMTSQIEADLKDDVKLYDIFKAIFPCGSITGAPKISTMRIIDEVEKGQRDIYCGAIGLISPAETVFSVPIRILQRKTPLLTLSPNSSPEGGEPYGKTFRYRVGGATHAAMPEDGRKIFRYRVGGAIVWDSDIQDEWEETLTKTRFLNENVIAKKALSDAAILSNLDEDFQIVETIKAENGKLLFEKEHFERMKKSAKYFGFKLLKKSSLNREDLGGLQLIPTPTLPNQGGYIYRILLNKDGSICTELKPLNPVKTTKILISPIVINSKNEFIYHKTTYRPWYNDSLQKISAGEVFDEIFFNEKGELTEGSRSNIILEIDGKLYTPPVSCGLLDGIFKRQMKNVIEKVLYKSDLHKADRIFCVNSVRGMVEVYL